VTMKDGFEKNLSTTKITCRECNKTKELKQYRIVRGVRREVCLSCEGKGVREVQTRRLRGEYGESVMSLVGDLKHCAACDGVYEIASFRKNKSKDGHFSKCISCETEGLPLMTKAQLNAYRNKTAAATLPNTVDSTKELVQEAKQIVENVSETVDELKGFWSRVGVWWSKLLAWIF